MIYKYKLGDVVFFPGGFTGFNTLKAGVYEIRAIVSNRPPHSAALEPIYSVRDTSNFLHTIPEKYLVPATPAAMVLFA